jgi:hypothetical protein
MPTLHFEILAEAVHSCSCLLLSLIVVVSASLIPAVATPPLGSARLPCGYPSLEEQDLIRAIELETDGHVMFNGKGSLQGRSKAAGTLQPRDVLALVTIPASLNLWCHYQGHYGWHST